MTRPEAIVLDFFAITDPRALLESLVVFRQSHRRILVEHLSVENIALDWASNAVGDVSCELRDPDPIQFLSSGFDAASCEV